MIDRKTEERVTVRSSVVEIVVEGRMENRIQADVRGLYVVSDGTEKGR